MIARSLSSPAFRDKRHHLPEDLDGPGGAGQAT